MPKNLKLTPKVKETVSSDRVKRAVWEFKEELIKSLDVKSPNTVLVGIQTRGAILAERLAAMLKEESNLDILVGALDITLYRDDYSTSGVQPIVGDTHLNFDLDGKKIILIDDVLFTGRTIRAALDELMDFGRPEKVSLAVLIDRGHRELPIKADYASMTFKTKRDESVNLHLEEKDGKDEIVICEPLKD